MTAKTNKQLYAELTKMLNKVEADLQDIAKFAEENQLEFKILGATYIPKTDEVRCEYSEEMYPTEDIEPSEEAGFYSPDDRGRFWVSSNCW